MTENENASQEAVHRGDQGSKRKLYLAFGVCLVIMLVFGALRLAKLSGQGSGKNTKPQCKPKYTSCVLSCNKQSVAFSRNIQNAATPKEKSKWEQRLLDVHRVCIPVCFQVHCMGKTPEAATKSIKAAKTVKQ